MKQPSRTPRATHGRHACLAVLALVLACSGGGDSGPEASESLVRELAAPTLEIQDSGTGALLQAVSPVSDQVVWVSGHEGTYAVTTDGGTTWDARRGPAGDSLQFRDVHGFDSLRAVLMSAGPGSSSRIYRTGDGGSTWDLSFLMDDERGFLDCLDFIDEERGVAYGDSFDGVPYLLRTDDGGASWERVAAASLPSAPEGEGGFAASGTCVRASPSGSVWVATGAAGVARVLTSRDAGSTWSVASAPVIRGDAGGLLSIDFRSDDAGIAFGGNLEITTVHTDNVVVTRDGGATWNLAGRLQMLGPVYGGAYAPGTRAVVAVGPGGVDYSLDEGQSWMGLDTLTYWAVGFASPEAGWMVGPEGRITKVRFDGE